MMADDIQELERKKQYATIYDDYASQDFKNSLSRRRFLIITNCVETYLGGVDAEGYDPHDLGFRRENLKKTTASYLDVLNRKVHRVLGGLVDEQMVFVPDGLNFRLNGLYWISKDKQFLQCVAESPAKDQEGQPATETATETQQPATEPGATAQTGQSTGQTSANGTATEATGANASTETKPSETGTESGSASSETSERKTSSPSPVQEMKPAEARKATAIQARPAGAGAVIDQRPSAPARPKKTTATEGEGAQSQPPIPGNEPSTSRRIEPPHESGAANNRAIPSSIPPLKPANEQSTPPTPR